MFDSSWRVLCDAPMSSICLFGQVRCEALQNQTGPAAPALTASLKAYKGCRRAIMCTRGKQSKSVCVREQEGERLFENVPSYLYVKFTVQFLTFVEIVAFIWTVVCISSAHLPEKGSFSGCNSLSLLFLAVAFPPPDSLPFRAIFFYFHSVTALSDRPPPSDFPFFLVLPFVWSGLSHREKVKMSSARVLVIMVQARRIHGQWLEGSLGLDCINWREGSSRCVKLHRLLLWNAEVSNLSRSAIYVIHKPGVIKTLRWCNK